MIEDKKFVKYLAEQTGIPEVKIQDLVNQGFDDFQIAAILIGKHHVKKEDLGRSWGAYIGYTYVDPLDSMTNIEYIKKAGLDFILARKSLPLYKLGKAVTVAMTDPQNPFLQGKVEDKLGEVISAVFCFPFDIENYILTHSIAKKLEEK